MDILIGKRQQGKTTHLIKMSAAGEGINGAWCCLYQDFG